MQISVRVRRTAILAVPVLVIAGFAVAGGSRSAAGAAIGVAMVVLFFAGGRAPMALANTTPAGLLFLLVVFGYLLRVLLLVVVLRAIGGASWVSSPAVGATVISGALLWTAVLVHDHLTSRQPTIVIAPTPVLHPAEVSR
jgi:ATP synthase protein I